MRCGNTSIYQLRQSLNNEEFSFLLKTNPLGEGRGMELFRDMAQIVQESSAFLCWILL